MADATEKKKTDDDDDYDPYAHRQVEKPTNDMETLMHLLKGSLGSGLMAIPYAFKNAGLSTGVILTIFTGFLCTYCVHMLVKTAHRLQYRNKKPKYSFNEVFQESLLCGPKFCQKLSWWGSFLVDLFLSIDLYGCCTIYATTAAKNIKQVVDIYYVLDERIYMVLVWPFLLILGCIRHLKYLAPLSAFANFLMLTCLVIIYYYVFLELHHPNKVLQFTEVRYLPVFFGVCIFSLEGIGVVMPLENNMKNPTHFIGCPSVLNIGMALVVALYTVTGFFGYLRYGDASSGSITLNLPEEEWPGKLAKIAMAVAILITYGLQFYVPFEITWKNMKKFKFIQKHERLKEYICRMIAVTLTVLVGIAIPNIGPMIGLVGALTLSFLGLIFPGIADSCVNYDQKTMGKCKWKLVKNIGIMIFGVIGCVSGVFVSILEIIDSLKKGTYK